MNDVSCIQHQLTLRILDKNAVIKSNLENVYECNDGVILVYHEQ